MCGIAGILDFDGRPVAPGRVRAMTDALVHRGPDDEGIYVGAGGVGLGMRRLAIIDLDGGRQPIANEDGTVRVVLNGEIYNFAALRRRLEAAGHRFSTASDTEVIVHLYEDHGTGCVEHLRGMFAFALWDERRRRLLVARDRIGIKPLYYARRGGALYFASEVKAILATGEVPAELDWPAVEHLFTFSTTPETRSIVAGIEKLEPGCLLLASAGGGVAVRRWWELRFEPDRRPSEDEWCEALRDTLAESVRLHRVSDVPLGAFLSGGVDSSAVVAAMARDGGGGPVSTFSIGFRESDYDELDYARMVARACGTRHRESVLEPEVLGVLDELAWYLDEPFGDSSAIPTLMVSRMAAEEVTVVLSGDGGDELFAGYDRYLVERRERRYRFLPRPLRWAAGRLGEALPEGATGRELLRHLALDGADRTLDAGTLFKADQRARLFTPEALAGQTGEGPWAAARRHLDTADCHWLSALQRLDLATYLPLDILTKVDRMSMACSLEARVPLLDHVMIELAARIPPELQLRGDRTKHLFKRALEGWVPQPVLDRPKRGFAIPLGRWFRGRLGGFVRELLLSPAARARGIFRPDYVEKLLRLHDAGRPLDLQLWTLISFELWCRTFLDRPVEARQPSGRVDQPAGHVDQSAGRVDLDAAGRPPVTAAAGGRG
jgi:asparagine synthase (glutamine-hydrolysing)